MVVASEKQELMMAVGTNCSFKIKKFIAAVVHFFGIFALVLRSECKVVGIPFNAKIWLYSHKPYK